MPSNTQSFSEWVDLSTYRLIDWLIGGLIHSCYSWLIDWLIDCLWLSKKNWHSKSCTTPLTFCDMESRPQIPSNDDPIDHNKQNFGSSDGTVKDSLPFGNVNHLGLHRLSVTFLHLHNTAFPVRRGTQPTNPLRKLWKDICWRRRQWQFFLWQDGFRFLQFMKKAEPINQSINRNNRTHKHVRINQSINRQYQWKSVRIS